MPPLSPATLRQACWALGWFAADLADAAKITDRNARYWLSGLKEPDNPDEIRAMLREALTQKANAVAAAIRAMDGR